MRVQGGPGEYVSYNIRLSHRLSIADPRRTSVFLNGRDRREANRRQQVRTFRPQSWLLTCGWAVPAAGS